MTTEQMPAFIEEANRLYASDPGGAVALLYEGTRKLKERMPETGPRGPKGFKDERDRQIFLLETGHRLMRELLEDADEGILPNSLEWELDLGVAQDIVRITRQYGY